MVLSSDGEQLDDRRTAHRLGVCQPSLGTPTVQTRHLMSNAMRTDAVEERPDQCVCMCMCVDHVCVHLSVCVYVPARHEGRNGKRVWKTAYAAEGVTH